MVIGSVLQKQATRPPCASPETPVAEAARVMAGTGIGTLPVIDRDGRLVGLVAERDILSLAAERRSGIRGLAVEEVMQRDVVTMPAEAPVETALTVMERARFRHMPVCDGQGRLLGLVGLADLLHLVLRGGAPAASAA
ncbi:CBS domain-containing protein [Roseomonas rosulenta]|uniref:CBS domain-containing protein n=1 Tax=Roseomonas rosulenta TaxID=2748667 RepID=UPI0018E00D26|nr:CBS domain-containing protein [Roseomonas rosulenta]